LPPESRGWREKARDLKREVYTLYFAMRDPRVPWYAKALAACVVGYALSPIDLIPDFIPVLGYLDELLLIPLGVLAVRTMIPAGVRAECRERAAQASEKPPGRLAAAIIVAIWLLVAAASGYWLFRWLSN
jgi:uncharacterized membrane protein YkvA (DUF1232 family)